MKYLVILISALFLTSCYSYEGPTRELASQALPPTPIKARAPMPEEKLSSQDYLVKMAGEIKKKLPEAEVKILQDSIKVLFPNNIVYDKNRTTPIQEIYVPIGKLAKLINKFDKTDILVTGHSDNVGDANLNKKISKLRAGYILDLVAAYHVDKNRLASWGLGGNSPIASNLTEEGRAKNRRVEFVILTMVDY